MYLESQTFYSPRHDGTPNKGTPPYPHRAGRPRAPYWRRRLSRECFCSKETIDDHLAQDDRRREKITAPEGARLQVGRLVGPQDCVMRDDVIPLAT